MMSPMSSLLVKWVSTGQPAGISFAGEKEVGHEPYVLVKPLRLSPLENNPKPARKRHKRCRRMLFDRRKTHSVVRKSPLPLHCDMKRIKYQNNDCGCLSGFHGFSNEEISGSADESRSAVHSLESTFLLVGDRGVKCLSISTFNTQDHVQHVMQVIPLKRVPIRVLSLFDGVGTGLYVLKEKLSLLVADYFSSEVDPHAIEVQRHHFHGQIHMLGCVTQLSETLLHSLGRIDLLIGGSPCNELSRVNPRRKGLFDPSGSGPLFLEYVRIRNLLFKQAAVGGHPFFWFFENVHNMDDSSKQQISQSLQSSPITKCASDFLPVKRKRPFWGNIPGMGSEEQEASPPTLQTLLKPYRKPRPNKKHPIMDNGKGCGLTVTEREIMFGFPEHYTDVGNLTNSQRLKLLGRSWCVPVIASLLKPLSEMYAHA